MPTIAVDKARLFEALGQSFTPAEFDDLCFDFGLELDEDTENDPARPANEPPQLKIEIGANRYDMLCEEGIALQLNIFRGKEIPKFRLVDVPAEKMQRIVVSKETARVRPFVAGAILRDITFTQASYDNFIALQDKLHQNLARQRTLVSIGTHDMDTIQGPFSYEALPPNDIKFIPLNQTKSMTGEELMTFYETDKHLGRYLHIIRDSPVYPVIYDSNKVVCSLPPIINGDRSKITLDTRNVFIEVTATDKTKLAIVLNMMVCMFSGYCKNQWAVEPVMIVSEHNDQTRITPDLSSRRMEVEVDHINSICGISEDAAGLVKLLTRMSYHASPSKDGKSVQLAVPPLRADVLHASDVVEDVAIAYGYNNLPRSAPNRSATIGKPLPLNQLSDIVRSECAHAGWTEVMPLVLCGYDEAFGFLNRKDDGKTVVKLANPKTLEFQVARPSLLPGLLKTIRENASVRLPLMITEVADVVLKDSGAERGARNERRWAAAYCGRSASFEMVHGLLDHVMSMLRTAFITHEEGLEGKSPDYEVKENPSKANGYYISEIDEPTFFNGRGAAIYARLSGKVIRIGELGILHPTVLQNYGLRYPVSVLEVNLEVFL